MRGTQHLRRMARRDVQAAAVYPFCCLTEITTGATRVPGWCGPTGGRMGDRATTKGSMTAAQVRLGRLAQRKLIHRATAARSVEGGKWESF
jgi:hypothetical protein